MKKRSLTPPPKKHFAIIGAGMAGVACARTLVQAGHHVTVFEKNATLGGRMAMRTSPFGTFDSGAQYFTVRDPRFTRALATVPDLCKPWSATAVRVHDAAGRVVSAGLPTNEAHWVPVPGMNALTSRWALPLMEQHTVEMETQVTRIERDPLHPRLWQLRTEGPGGAQGIFADFDAVLLAIPAEPARLLLETSPLGDTIARELNDVQTTPCWTLLLAFPQAMQPNLHSLGPQWNAARSTHHRIAWLARESSKPGRSTIERWTVQASAAWSHEHLEDSPERVQAKMLKAFGEVTGIRAVPSYTEMVRWRDAQTTQPLGKTHVWDAQGRLGVCGDWCIGHRVEDAFISGLELALSVI